MTGLREAVALLGGGEANRAVRVQVVRAGVPGAAPTSLRLTTHDATGWWEFTDVPVNADAPESRSVVVDLDELDSALDNVSRFAGATSAQLLVDGNVTIGTHLLLARDTVDVPALAHDVTAVEPLDLQKADRSGLVVESQVGRLYASPEVLGHLKRRHARQVELALIGDVPFVTAQVTGHQGGTSTIATPLPALADGEVPTLPERRTTSGSEVSQLVNALATTTSQEELARLLKVGVGYVRRKAAAHPALEKQVITSLVKEGTEAMRAAAATNPSIGVAAREIAMSDPSAIVRASLAGNPAISEAELQLLAEDPVASVRAAAVGNPKATPELVARLADDPDDLVRAAVASHQGIHVELLRELAHDPAAAVCKAVAKNPSCPTDVLLELVSTVPDAVLANPNASEALLTAGSVVDDPSLRAAVAKNPATGPKLLRKLARDRDPEVLRGVATHPQTPLVARRRVQRQLSTDPLVEPGA
jgi:hypothetical protein